MEEILEACFLEWFGTGRGVVWRKEMMESFWVGSVGSVGVGDYKKQTRNGGQWMEWGRGGVERGGGEGKRSGGEAGTVVSFIARKTL